MVTEYINPKLSRLCAENDEYSKEWKEKDEKDEKEKKRNETRREEIQKWDINFVRVLKTQVHIDSIFL